MSKKSSALAAAGILAAAVVLSGFSIYKDSHQKNSTDGTITLRMAQTSSQAGAIGQSMEAFADRIYDETEGKYKIETYHNGQLGAEIDTIEGCQMGTIDIAVVNQSTIGNFINDFQALDIPYLITTSHPASIRPSAIPWPRPLVPPVTIAFFPSILNNSMIIFSSQISLSQTGLPSSSRTHPDDPSDRIPCRYR